MLESLEDRRLLAFTDLAVIEGTLFYDLPGIVDQPIPGQPVRLYRDGNGNGAFDGAATDPLQGTQLTNADGYYRFDTLSAATYFLQQPPEPSGYLQPPPVAEVRTIVVTPADADGNQGLMIDAFEDHQALVAQRPPAGIATVHDSMPASGAIGGQRTLIVNAVSDTGAVRVVIDENGNSLFNYAEGPAVVGNATVIWDGTAGDHTEPNPTGLGGVDLTGAGAQDSFELTSPVTDVPAVVTFTVYTDAAHVSERQFTVPGFTTQVFRPIKFAEFNAKAGHGPADFTNVGAIKFEVNKAPGFAKFGLDYQLEAVATVGPTIRREDLPYPVRSHIDLVKLTNGTDNDASPGPLVPVGSVVIWTYRVTNPGSESIAGVEVTDDQLAPGDQPVPVLAGGFNAGDTNRNYLLDAGEIWLFTATGVAVAGQYANLGTATGTGVISSAQLTHANPDHYFGVASAIHVEKATNGQDADTPTGPLVAADSMVTWTYTVTNPGNVPLSNVLVRDNNGTPTNPADDFNATLVGGDTNSNSQLDVGETWQYQATGIAVAGQYANVATATGIDPVGQTQTDTDPSHYFGVASAIDVEKATNGQDADTPTGPLVAAGSVVTWSYVVTNPGNVPLSNVVVRDNNGTPANPADDFNATFVGGDANGNSQLDVGETWQYQATGIAVAGQYANVATATGIDPLGQTPSDTDLSHYFGEAPAIDIEKATNGLDADSPTGPFVWARSTVTWTYVVTNPGDVSLSNVVVRDDNGTPGNPADDFTPKVVGGDGNGNGRLDVGETWRYEATGTALVGLYGNAATATGIAPSGRTVFDMDPSHYFAVDRIDESDEKPFVVLGPDKNPGAPQAVRVMDIRTGQVRPEYGFVAYEDDYVGGTRVALADLDGDGIDEVITAPGRNRAPDVKVFTLEGDFVPGFPSFLAYGAAYTRGVELTVADVNGDGKPDIITVPSSGASEVRVFFNRYDGLDPSKPAFKADPDIAFQAFSVVTVGGAVVAAADLGSRVGGSFVNALDGKAEIIVGTGGGSKATVSVFEVSGATPARVRTFYPFTAANPSFAGGVSLDVAWIDQSANPQQDPPDVVVGMGVNGTSRIEIWKWDISDASLAIRGAIPAAFTGPSNNAPVRVAALDADGNGIAEAILAVQGPIGTTGQIHRFDITGTTPFLVQQAPPLTGFSGPWFIATSKTGMSDTAPPAFPNLPAPELAWTNTVNAYDVNNDGRATPLDVLEVINYINSHPGETALPAQQSIPPRFFDCNVDRVITPADALFVLNSFNNTSPYSGEGERSELTGGTAGISVPLDLERGPVEAPSAPWMPEGGRQEALDALGPTIVAGVERAAPEVALPSPLVPHSVQPPFDDFSLFELEAVLDEIVAGVAGA